MPLDRDQGISIHSLRMEGDMIWRTENVTQFAFQSTPSAWRETFLDCVPEHTEEFQSTPSAWRETQLG